MVTPEGGNLIRVDPAELMRDNPAASIVNKDSYADMGAYFYPERLDPPQVVRVATFSAPDKEAIKLFIVDGMTRTKYAADHKGMKLPDFPDFSFDRILVRDVTEGALRNPNYVYNTEGFQGQDALTIVQYFRAVIPPTIEHAQIAPDRIAAFLINGWENMVGPETAKKFSALAALTFLVATKAPTATEYLLKEHLSRQKALITDETREERSRLETNLLQMGAVIRESKRFKEEIARAAYALVSATPEAIGGQKETSKQIFGLLYSPSLSRKLEGYSIGEQDEKRRKLGRLIADVLERTANRTEFQQVTEKIDEILRDEKLDYSTTERILESSDVVREYTKAQKEINARKLKDHYVRIVRREELTPVETAIIGQLGGRTHLHDSEIPGLSKVIQEIDRDIRQTEAFVAKLESQREQLVGQGVETSTIDEIIGKLSVASASLLETDSRQALSKRSQVIKDTISAGQGKIDREIRLYTAGKIVEDVFGEARPDVTHLCFRERFTGVQIRETAEQIKTLDLDLQARVISVTGDWKLDRALREQERRKQAISRPIVSDYVATQKLAEGKREDVAGPLTIESQPQIARANQDLLDKKAADERRIGINVERLARGIRDFRNVLTDIDLVRDEIPRKVIEEFDFILNEQGKLRFEHPDIVRILKDYPTLLKQLQTLREARHHQEQIDLSKDTQTQI